jgi:GNAT superfamily N-acetyltransferase
VGTPTVGIFPLVGYALFFVRSSVQMQHLTIGQDEAFCIAPEHRGGMLAVWFLRRCEEILRDNHVDLWIMGDRQFSGGQDLRKLYARIGLAPSGVTYVKKLFGDRT